MPYMRIFKQDGKWHYGGGFTRTPACTVTWTDASPWLKLGGGPEFGCDKDPPKADMCIYCFKWLKTEL